MIADLFVIQVFCCFFLTGLIWLVQIVHYPAFNFVDLVRFRDFCAFHSNRITFIVAPIMVGDLASSFGIAYLVGGAGFWCNFAGAALTWVSTAALSVPCHNALGREHSVAQIRKLVLTNWPRTLLWSARSAFLCVVLMRALRVWEN